MSLIVQAHFTTDATSSYQEGSAYIIATPEVAGSLSFDIPYSDLVPSGETRPIHISHCSAFQKYLSAHYVSYYVLVESPASSNTWKMTLAVVKDLSPAVASNDFSQPVILTSNDDLCLKVNCSNEADTGSQFIVGIHYRVGP